MVSVFLGVRGWVVFLFQAEDGIRDLVRSRGLGDVYKRQSRIWNGTLHRDLLVYLLGAPLCYDNMDAPIEELLSLIHI